MAEQQTTQQTMIVPVQLVQAIGNYLMKRPFEEVAPLMFAINQAAQEQMLRGANQQAPAPAPEPAQEPATEPTPEAAAA